MASPWTLDNSGTTTPTVGTENFVRTSTTNGTFVFEVDTANMVLGDETELRVYTKTLTGGASTLLWFGACQDVTGGTTKKVSPFVGSDIEIKVSILQTAGTARAFPWKLLVM
jgi:hypothetical protein